MAKKRPRPTAAQLDAAEQALERAAANPQLIEGIYNYCDRWCERCPMTSRCLVYTMEQASSVANPDKGAGNEAFWDAIATSFELALRLVWKEAKKQGIDLDTPNILAEVECEDRRRRRVAATEGVSLRRAASGYWKSAKALLQRLDPELKGMEQVLEQQARLGTGEPEQTARDIRDALEVVEWYLFFIEVKLQRALSSRVETRETGDDGVDANGSAKVALVGIDRSIAAWARLRGHLSGEADTILDLLVRLEKLRRASEREFPQARGFKRPGFD